MGLPENIHHPRAGHVPFRARRTSSCAAKKPASAPSRRHCAASRPQFRLYRKGKPAFLGSPVFDKANPFCRNCKEAIPVRRIFVSHSHTQRNVMPAHAGIQDYNHKRWIPAWRGNDNEVVGRTSKVDTMAGNSKNNKTNPFCRKRKEAIPGQRIFVSHSHTKRNVMPEHANIQDYNHERWIPAWRGNDNEVVGRTSKVDTMAGNSKNNKANPFCRKLKKDKRIQ
jgi:hypothetical protein